MNEESVMFHAQYSHKAASTAVYEFKEEPPDGMWHWTHVTGVCSSAASRVIQFGFRIGAKRYWIDRMTLTTQDKEYTTTMDVPIPANAVPILYAANASPAQVFTITILGYRWVNK